MITGRRRPSSSRLWSAGRRVSYHESMKDREKGPTKVVDVVQGREVAACANLRSAPRRLPDSQGRWNSQQAHGVRVSVLIDARESGSACNGRVVQQANADGVGDLAPHDGADLGAQIFGCLARRKREEIGEPDSKEECQREPVKASGGREEDALSVLQRAGVDLSVGNGGVTEVGEQRRRDVEDLSLPGSLPGPTSAR